MSAQHGSGERLAGFLIRSWWWTMPAAIALAVALASGAGAWLQPDNSVRIWFLEQDPALTAYDDFKAQFGNDEVVVIAATSPAGAYDPALLERVRAASHQLEELASIRKVTSLGVGRHIAGDAFELRVEPLLGEGPVSSAMAEAVRARVAANPALRGTLVNEGGTMTLILAQLSRVDDIDAARPAILDAVRAICGETLRGEGTEFHLGGIGVIYDALNRAVLRDSELFIALSYLVILFGLWLAFRRLIWVALGLALVSIAIAASVGLFGLLGRHMNMVTSILPTLIVTVGVLDLVHLIDEGQSRPRDMAMPRALGAVAVPCIFNTLTDSIGFSALASARMGAVRDFGLFAAAGLGILLAVSLVFAVPAIARFGRCVSRDPARPGWAMALVGALGHLASRHRRGVLVGAAAIVLLSGVGIALLEVDTYTIEFLDKDHRARRDHRAIEDNFGAYVPLEMTIRAPAPDGLKDPALLRDLEHLERQFEADPRVDRVTGLPEILIRINQVVMDGKVDAARIPDSAAAVAQELLLYEADPDNDLSDLVDADFQVGRMTARAHMTTARGVRDLIADLEHTSHALLGDRAEVRAAGYLPLYVRIIEHITRAQVTSFALALAMITLVLMVILRSFKLGLVAMIPNLLPVGMTLGVMGFAGIRLDVGTVLLASIAIGISVNDTTHLLFRFREELRASPFDTNTALERTLLGTGRAVLLSSLILIAGFSVLALASTKSIAYFGALSAVTAAAAIVADLLVTPALLGTVSFAPPRSRERGAARGLDV